MGTFDDNKSLTVGLSESRVYSEFKVRVDISNQHESRCRDHKVRLLQQCGRQQLTCDDAT